MLITILGGWATVGLEFSQSERFESILNALLISFSSFFIKNSFQILNVSCNKLTSLKGLESNLELVELNLSGNQLSELGPQIIKMTKLKVLKISGNQFESVVQLDRLRVINLREVELADKLYPLAPMCQLTNYSLQIIYTLQSLEVNNQVKLSLI